MEVADKKKSQKGKKNKGAGAAGANPQAPAKPTVVAPKAGNAKAVATATLPSGKAATTSDARSRECSPEEFHDAVSQLPTEPQMELKSEEPSLEEALQRIRVLEAGAFRAAQEQEEFQNRISSLEKALASEKKGNATLNKRCEEMAKKKDEELKVRCEEIAKKKDEEIAAIKHELETARKRYAIADGVIKDKDKHIKKVEAQRAEREPLLATAFAEVKTLRVEKRQAPSDFEPFANQFYSLQKSYASEAMAVDNERIAKTRAENRAVILEKQVEALLRGEPLPQLDDITMEDMRDINTNLLRLFHPC
jgi:hypothetical protein